MWVYGETAAGEEAASAMSSLLLESRKGWWMFLKKSDRLSIAFSSIIAEYLARIDAELSITSRYLSTRA